MGAAGGEAEQGRGGPRTSNRDSRTIIVIVITTMIHNSSKSNNSNSSSKNKARPAKIPKIHTCMHIHVRLAVSFTVMGM